ncbi:phosphotransferase [Paenibacillus popilliae]|nr:phosphotransferase [Paenibacillus popilliae]
MARRISTARLRPFVRRYGLHLRHIQPCHSLYRRNAAFRALTDKGVYVIKPFYRRRIRTTLTTKQQIVRITAYIHKLQAKNYPHLPHWLVNTSGRYWVYQSGRPYYMIEWVEGGNLQHEEHYEQLGRALGTLHTICQEDLPPMSPYTSRQIAFFQDQDRIFRRRLSMMRKRKGTTAWFREHGDQCIRLAEEAWMSIQRPETQQVLQDEIRFPALIHGDVTCPNVIMHSNGLYLIDWDQVRMDSTYYEIAKTLLNTTNFNPLLMGALLQGYELVHPLAEAERILIGSLFRLPVEAWAAARSAVTGQGSRLSRLLQNTWAERLAAIQWLDEWGGQSGRS